jgi:hypothetical protein
MKDKKHYYVVFSGLNELGVQEMNEFYKNSIRLNYIKTFKLNADFTKRSKRFKLINQFGPEAQVETYDLARSPVDENGNLDNYYGRAYFTIQIKHMNHEVYEVNETYTLVK